MYDVAFLRRKICLIWNRKVLAWEPHVYFIWKKNLYCYWSSHNESISYKLGMCTGKAALCGWERGSSIPYTVIHINEELKDLQAGQGSAQDPTKPQCYFMHKQYFKHKPQYLKNSPLVNKLSESKYQAFPWRFGGAGNPAGVTNHSWQHATLQMPRSTFMALLPQGFGLSTWQPCAIREHPQNPAMVFCLPKPLFFLQHLGQGSLLLPPSPSPHCRVGPLEEKISKIKEVICFPRAPLPCHPSPQEGGAIPPSAWILTVL